MIAGQLEIPTAVVEARNRVAHGEAPPHEELRECCAQCYEWLRKYWENKVAEIQNG
jgi:hypothetical protein